MRRVTIIIIGALMTVGCSNGSTGGPEFDSSNPIACLAIFGIAANGYQQAGNASAAERMVEKSMLVARQQGGAEWVQSAMPEARQIGARIEAANDREASDRLLQECEAK